MAAGLLMEGTMKRILSQGDPVETVAAALIQLKQQGVPVSKRNVEKITLFTRVEIAGIIGRDYNLQTMFDEMRHS